MYSGVRATDTVGAWLLAGGLGGVAAGIINLVIQLVYQANAGRPLQIVIGGPDAPPQGLPLPQTFLVTLLVGLVGGVVAYILTRRTRSAATIYLVLAVIVLALSFVPLFVLALSSGNRLTLAAMHLVAAIAVTGAIWPLFRRFGAA